MTQGKFTPGPWEVLAGPEWGGFTVSGARLVATMTEWGYPGEAEANAHLTAAAPAMLAALESIYTDDDGLVYGLMRGRCDDEPVKGYRYSYDDDRARALDYLRDMDTRKNGARPEGWNEWLQMAGGEYVGATFGARGWVADQWEQRPNFETFTMETVKIPGYETWADGSHSVLMPRERAVPRADVALEIEGDSVYPLAVNSADKIHLSKEQVRGIVGESAFETMAITMPDGSEAFILAWLWRDGASRFLTVGADGRTFAGGRYVTRAEIEAGPVLETVAEAAPEAVAVDMPEIPATAGAEGEGEAQAAQRAVEVPDALSGPEIAPVELVSEAYTLPAPAPVKECLTTEPDGMAAMLARIEALEARLAPQSGEYEQAPIGGAEAPPVEAIQPAKRTAAHERAIRRAWAERKARRREVAGLREGIAFERHVGECERLRNAELADEVHRLKGRLASTQSAFEQWHQEGLRGYEQIRAQRAKRRRAVLLARQRGREMANLAQVAHAYADQAKVARAMTADYGQHGPERLGEIVARLEQVEAAGARHKLRADTAGEKLAAAQSTLDRLAGEIEAATLRALKAETALRAVEARANGWPPAARPVAVNVSFGGAIAA